MQGAVHGREEGVCREPPDEVAPLLSTMISWTGSRTAIADGLPSTRSRSDQNGDMDYVIDGRENWSLNLMPGIRPYFMDLVGRRLLALHKDRNSGRSSQIMLMNLVGPLLVQGQLAALKPMFEERGLLWPSDDVAAVFEYESRSVLNECGPGKPTSMDLAILATRPELLLECKLTEDRFGACSAAESCTRRNPRDNFDRCYWHLRGRHYWLHLDRFGFLDLPAWHTPECPLAANYQFFRELLFAQRLGAPYVLLRHADNYLIGDLVDDLRDSVPATMQSRVFVLTIQSLFRLLTVVAGDAWGEEFALRYALGE